MSQTSESVISGGLLERLITSLLRGLWGPLVRLLWFLVLFLGVAGAILTIAYFVASLPHEESPQWLQDMARIEVSK